MVMNCPVKITMSTDERKKNVSGNGIADFLTSEQVDLLRSVMRPKRVESGTHLFWEGDAAGKLYYVRSGRVKLWKSTEDGKELLLTILQTGDLFGEVGDSGHTHYSYSAEAACLADVGVTAWHDLEPLLRRHSELALAFMSWMGRMHRVLQSKLRDLLLFGKSGALASTLIRLGNTYGVSCEGGVRVDVKLTNAELAAFIGTTRESVNRMLSAMKEEGTVDTVNGNIVIRRPNELRRMCHCPTSPACPHDVCRI